MEGEKVDGATRASPREEPNESPAVADQFRDLLLNVSISSSEIASQLFIIFHDFLNHRESRIELSWQPLPTVLKFTLILVDVGVVCLSFLIGVKDFWLDYI